MEQLIDNDYGAKLAINGETRKSTPEKQSPDDLMVTGVETRFPGLGMLMLARYVESTSILYQV